MCLHCRVRFPRKGRRPPPPHKAYPLPPLWLGAARADTHDLWESCLQPCRKDHQQPLCACTLCSHTRKNQKPHVICTDQPQQVVLHSEWMSPDDANRSRSPHPPLNRSSVYLDHPVMNCLQPVLTLQECRATDSDLLKATAPHPMGCWGSASGVPGSAAPQLSQVSTRTTLVHSLRTATSTNAEFSHPQFGVMSKV